MSYSPEREAAFRPFLYILLVVVACVIYVALIEGPRWIRKGYEPPMNHTVQEFMKK